MNSILRINIAWNKIYYVEPLLQISTEQVCTLNSISSGVVENYLWQKNKGLQIILQGSAIGDSFIIENFSNLPIFFASYIAHISSCFFKLFTPALLSYPSLSFFSNRPYCFAFLSFFIFLYYFSYTRCSFLLLNSEDMKNRCRGSGRGEGEGGRVGVEGGRGGGGSGVA
jgi:hypothetical protein